MGLCAGGALAAQPAGKPPVPIGVDPGGVLIAIIGDGIDYTRPEIAARLARDGEGELIGWDLVDNDRRPFGQPPSNFNSIATATVRAIVTEQGYPRIAPFRVMDPTSTSVGRAIMMAAQAQSRVIVVRVSPDENTTRVAATMANPAKLI